MNVLARTLTNLFPSVTMTMDNSTPQAAMAKVLDDFREQRASDIYELAEKSGQRGAKLCRAERELNEWRLYARKLEQTCLAAGLALPAAPDEG